MSGAPPRSRRGGILIPLFSLVSSRGWGIGEITDIGPVARWLESAGQRILQLLPINEMPPGETSPYSALSAMAVDPQFIALHALEDFEATGGEQAMAPRMRQRLDVVREAVAIDYPTVRELKQAALRRSYAHFRDRELASGTRRASSFLAFCQDQ